MAQGREKIVVIRMEDSVSNLAWDLLLIANAAEMAGTMLMEMDVTMEGGRLNKDMA